jgi:para-aminobenzoate synthetase component 1
VQKVIDYILAGDIFEANISQRFKADLPAGLAPFDLYRRLREINPAPFAAYLNFKDTQLASASPERFLKLSAGYVETRPIKGTRPRGKSEEEDATLARELVASEKDWAENVMIVDLLRNDLSRVCENHSVQVPQLCGLESYPSVHHLVSVVTGRLRSGMGALDLLKAAFPGGSITGAPKLRAMEIIAELEPTRRGPYCGSVAYLGFDGALDSSIIIRSFCIRQGQVSFQAGGAVVADSVPRQEQEEVLAKAGALFRALGSVYDPADR